MADYVPTGDDAFNNWQGALVTYVTANQTRFGLSTTQMQPVTGAQTTWNADYPAHVQASRNAATAATAKDGARTGYEATLRTFVSGLQTNANVTDEDRRAMDITIRSTTRTAVAVPTTAPIAQINFSQRLTHTIEFRDSTTPDSRAKPAGVRGCQIWVKIGGAAPTSPSECHFLATDTKTPYVNHFEMNEASQTVYYLLRWENTTGETGPWSAVFSAVVPA